MNFGELCQEVMVLTNRPDLVADTQSAVRNATLFLHGMDFWMRDLTERQVVYPASGNQFQFDIPGLFKGWRKFKYIRTWDPVTQTPGRYIKFCEPDKVFDAFDCKKTDIYYVAGRVANILTSCAESAFLVGWYQMPDVMGSYASWIADILPYAIVEQATGKLLCTIGQVDEGNKFIHPVSGSVTLQQIPLIRTNDVVPEA